MTDDIAFKRDFRWVDGSFPQVVRFVLQHTGLGAGLLDKFKVLLSSIATRESAAQELTTTRCQRGASIARRLRFPEPVAQGIHSLDEQWNGKGRPEVVDSKSPYTAGHSGRVALYTDLVAADLGLSAERRRWLYRGPLLHDVGKLGVSNSIFDKPGKLDAAEWDAVKKHATFTEQVLARFRNLRSWPWSRQAP